MANSCLRGCRLVVLLNVLEEIMYKTLWKWLWFSSIVHVTSFKIVMILVTNLSCLQSKGKMRPIITPILLKCRRVPGNMVQGSRELHLFLMFLFSHYPVWKTTTLFLSPVLSKKTSALFSRINLSRNVLSKGTNKSVPFRRKKWASSKFP